MTIHTQVLEARIGQLQSRTQLLLNRPVAADAPEFKDLWRELDGLATALWLALLQFDTLETQRAQLQDAVVSPAPGQSPAAPPRLASLDNELQSLRSRAGLLAATIVQLRRSVGDAPALDLSHAVYQLGTQLGKSLDPVMVRRLVYEASTQPRLAGVSASRADADNSVQALFVVIAMVVALLRERSSRAH